MVVFIMGQWNDSLWFTSLPSPSVPVSPSCGRTLPRWWCVVSRSSPTSSWRHFPHQCEWGEGRTHHRSVQPRQPSGGRRLWWGASPSTRRCEKTNRGVIIRTKTQRQKLYSTKKENTICIHFSYHIISFSPYFCIINNNDNRKNTNTTK